MTKRTPLTGSLLASKGSATPAADAPTRASEPATAADDVTLNLRVPPEFRRRLKTMSAQTDTPMVQIVVEAVEARMRERGF